MTVLSTCRYELSMIICEKVAYKGYSKNNHLRMTWLSGHMAAL